MTGEGRGRIPWYTWVVLVALVLAVGGAYLAFRVIDPWARARAELGRIGTPFAGSVVTGSSRGGGLLCIDACPVVKRAYSPAATVARLAQTRAEVESRLRDLGYRLTPETGCVAISYRGGLRFTCDISGARAGYKVDVALQVTPPAGTTLPRAGVGEPVRPDPSTPVLRVDVSVSTDRLL
jgi:hypothetical protein